MPEKPSGYILEREIYELSKKIEEKRGLLEKERGFVEEREIVREIVADKIAEDVEHSAVINIQPSPIKATSTYLDTLDEDSDKKIQFLVNGLSDKGIAKTIEAVKSESPLIVDAFHDTLTDKLYEMLIERGILK